MEDTIILATDSIVAKAYIQALKNAGHSPAMIVCLQLQDSNHSKLRRMASTLKRIVKGMKNSSLPVPGWLPEFQRYCQSEDLFVPDYEKSFSTVLKESGIKYQWLGVDGIEDPKLIQFLEEKVVEKHLIYCCGGLILRKSLLGGSKRFIHVHPGLVPEVKGSDGMLWSSLVLGKVGMSAFFMNEGIDTGDILQRREYDVPQLEIPTGQCGLSALADELVQYIDPVYRADLLVRLFQKEGNPGKWDFSRQDPKAGKVYYFMHEAIKEGATKKFLKSS